MCTEVHWRVALVVAHVQDRPESPQLLEQLQVPADGAHVCRAASLCVPRIGVGTGLQQGPSNVVVPLAAGKMESGVPSDGKVEGVRCAREDEN